MRFIGDVHGKFRRYRDIIRPVRQSIQVGDMGVGFRSTAGDTWGQPAANPPHDSMTRNGHDHCFIRGNHDNPNVCRKHSQYIPDGMYFDSWKMMCIGGAMSIDKHRRTEGFTMWHDEELSQGELMPIVDRFLEVKPRVMVTHECPEDVAPYLLNREKVEHPSITRQAFNSMWAMHQPELWIFGHYHRSFDKVMDGTRFICLAELEHMDIEI